MALLDAQDALDRTATMLRRVTLRPARQLAKLSQAVAAPALYAVAQLSPTLLAIARRCADPALRLDRPEDC